MSAPCLGPLDPNRACKWGVIGRYFGSGNHTTVRSQVAGEGWSKKSGALQVQWCAPRRGGRGLCRDTTGGGRGSMRSLPFTIPSLQVLDSFNPPGLIIGCLGRDGFPGLDLGVSGDWIEGYLGSGGNTGFISDHGTI